MNRKITNTITLILAVFGSLLASLLTAESLGYFTLPCPIKASGCAATMASAYSHIFGIPTAALGLGMYLLFIPLAIARKKQLEIVNSLASSQEGITTESGSAPAPANERSFSYVRPPLETISPSLKGMNQLIWLLGFSGFAISWWLQYTSIFILYSFCPYCFTSVLTVTLIFAIACYDLLIRGREINGEQKMLGAIVTFVLVMFAFVYIPQAVMIVEQGPSGPVVRPPSIRSKIIRPTSPSMGNPNAKYTLVEFADYGCPHCKDASEKLPALIKSRPDIRLIFRSYVLGLNMPQAHFPQSKNCAAAALAAGKQGEFWQYHNELFNDQDSIQSPQFDPQTFTDMARQMGLNVDKFNTDMQSKAVNQQIWDDFNDGNEAGVNSTPTFFLVTPDRITSFVGIERFETLLSTPKDKAWQ